MHSFPDPERILMTTDTVGGIWHYALELCRGFGAHGVQVVLATMGPRPKGEQRQAAGALSNVTICESDYRLEWMEGAGDEVAKAGDWLLRLEAEHAVDLVHLNGYSHGNLPWRTPVVVVGHSCVLSWWQAVYGGEAPAEWDGYRAAVGAGLRAADLVVAPSGAMLDLLEKNYGPFQSAEVIYNGRDPADFTPGPKEDFVLSVGRWWDRAKNAAVLAAVAPRLAWPVRLIGTNRLAEADALPAGSAAISGPYPPAVLADLYSRAAIYALPARYEPFGLSILEAALSGCALILGDIPSLREIWRDSALFVAPDDVAGIEAAIGELIANPGHRRALAGRARERAASFSSQRMTSSYLGAYHGCMESLLQKSHAALR